TPRFTYTTLFRSQRIPGKLPEILCTQLPGSHIAPVLYSMEKAKAVSYHICFKIIFPPGNDMRNTLRPQAFLHQFCLMMCPAENSKLSKTSHLAPALLPVRLMSL